MKAIRVCLGFKPGWCVVAVDANGHSSGTIAIWDPTMANLKAYNFFGGILLSSQIRGMVGTYNIKNLYVPYQNRIEFWKHM